MNMETQASIQQRRHGWTRPTDSELDPGAQEGRWEMKPSESSGTKTGSSSSMTFPTLAGANNPTATTHYCFTTHTHTHGHALLRTTNNNFFKNPDSSVGPSSCSAVWALCQTSRVSKPPAETDSRRCVVSTQRWKSPGGVPADLLISGDLKACRKRVSLPVRTLTSRKPAAVLKPAVFQSDIREMLNRLQLKRDTLYCSCPSEQ